MDVLSWQRTSISLWHPEERAWNAPHYANCCLIHLLLQETHVLSWHPQGSLITPGERWWLHWRFLIARLWRAACLLEGWVPHGKKWAVIPLYPLLSPQCLLTRRTSHLESPHSDSVTIHGHHFLKDKCLQKVPFILLLELHCLLPSRDPEVEE